MANKDIVLELIPKKSSGQEDWMTWYKTMKSKLGKKNAQVLWVKAWGKRGGKDSPANTLSLRKYMESEGIPIDGGGIISSAVDTASKGFDFFSDFFVAGKWMMIGSSVIIIGTVGLFLYNVAKDPVKSAGAAADLAGSIYTKGAVRVGK